MTIQDELIVILNQIPAAIEKAFYEALVLRHPGHGNQKTHGNRYGVGQAKESFRRLKDDKGAREQYKERHRKRALSNKKGEKQNQRLGESLAMVENDIKGKPKEHAYMFDKDGYLLLDKKGGKDYVSFTEDEVAQMSGAILTHNHPGGNSFSLEDGLILQSANLAEIRAVTGQYKHSLKMPQKPISKAKWEQTLQEAHEQTKKEFFDKIRKGEMTIRQAETTHFHNVWQTVAQQTGASYTREGW